MITTRNILILSGALIIVALISMFAFENGSKGTINTDETPIEVQEYFTERLQAGVVSKIGQPIEGFWPSMFMQVFTGMGPQDFEGAEALLGEYTIVEKELTFILDDSGSIHSAAEALSPEGMKTVLSNIEKRAEVSITTKEQVDGLLLFLGADINQ